MHLPPSDNACSSCLPGGMLSTYASYDEGSRILVLLIVLIVLSSTFGKAAHMTQTRRDFLRTEIKNANTFITDPLVKDEKYGQMKTSPSQFYRGTAHLYYADLSNGTITIPSAWKRQPNINIWLSGDFHTQNVGYSADQTGKVIFDLNDTDESYIGPFYWDLIRFSTSLYLLTDEISSTHLGDSSNFSYSASQQANLVNSFLQTYQDTLQRVSDHHDETNIQIDESYLQSGFIQDKLRDLQEKTQIDLLKKWTIKTSSGRRFDVTNPNLVPMTNERRTQFVNNWTSYTQSLSSSFVASKHRNYFTIKDCARRLHSGLGSLGVGKYYVLIEGESLSQNNEQILEVKEQMLPSLLKEGSNSASRYNGWFANHAQRTVIANKALGIKVDEHLGVISFESKSFRVRRIPPCRYGFETTDFSSKSDVNDFVTYTAKALALAHAHADKDYNPTYINYNFEQAYFAAIGAWPQFKTTVNRLSEGYYQQVLADHEMFTELLGTGQLG
jgi:uncharacterized protein (DUF2252 family)